jgi:acyl-CoA reductase-like NAD-dependent aldehyde dehydrogenase
MTANPSDEWLSLMEAHFALVRREAIEECAKVADADVDASEKTLKHAHSNGYTELQRTEHARARVGRKIAERIRALKETP